LANWSLAQLLLFLQLAGPVLVQIAVQQAQLFAQVDLAINRLCLEFPGLAMPGTRGRYLAKELLLKIAGKIEKEIEFI
jgi:hypothetical protein